MDSLRGGSNREDRQLVRLLGKHFPGLPAYAKIYGEPPGGFPRIIEVQRRQSAVQALINGAELLKVARLAEHKVEQIIAGNLARETEGALGQKDLGQDILLPDNFASKLHTVSAPDIGPVVADVVFSSRNAVQRIPIGAEVAADI